MTIGPATWAVSEKHFSNVNAEDVAKTLCGDSFAIKKVTKSVNNGREMVADVRHYQAVSSRISGISDMNTKSAEVL